MLRTIFGVIVGYAALFLAVFVTFTGVYAAIGADRAFMPGSYEPSTLWIAISIIVSLAAAAVGGYVAAWLGGSQTAPRALAVLALVFGVLYAIPVLNPPANDPQPTVRTGDVSNMEAMMNARQPIWIALVNPILAVGGILYGGSRRRTSR
jgi:hypothetical protein